MRSKYRQGCNTANAPAGSRARGTSMGGLYVTATLQAPLWKRAWCAHSSLVGLWLCSDESLEEPCSERCRSLAPSSPAPEWRMVGNCSSFFFLCMDIEPRAFRMRSGCDTTTPCAPEKEACHCPKLPVRYSHGTPARVPPRARLLSSPPTTFQSQWLRTSRDLPVASLSSYILLSLWGPGDAISISVPISITAQLGHLVRHCLHLFNFSPHYPAPLWLSSFPSAQVPPGAFAHPFGLVTGPRNSHRISTHVSPPPHRSQAAGPSYWHRWPPAL